MSKNNNYTTGNLLDYDYLSNHYKTNCNTFEQKN